MRIAAAAVACAVGFLPPAPVAQAEDPPQVLMQQKHWKRVRAIAQARLKASANDPEANYLMCRVLMAWDDSPAALPYAEKAVKLAPQNAAYHWALAEVVGDQAERANLLRQIGLARRFRSEAETVLKLDPKHIEAHFGMMIYYFKAPGIVGGDKKKAYAQAEEIGKIDRAKGYMAQVRLAQEEQHREKLEDLYKKAIEADPELIEPYIGIIGIAANAGNVADVERYSRQVLAIEPKRREGYNGLAWSFVKQKRWTDLDRILADAETAVPDDFVPYYTAANALLNTKEDLPRAERYFRKYLSQEREAGSPTHAVTHWRLGLVLEQQGRTPEAVAAIETAVKADPALDPAKKDLMRLKGSQRQPPEACAHQPFTAIVSGAVNRTANVAPRPIRTSFPRAGDQVQHARRLLTDAEPIPPGRSEQETAVGEHPQPSVCWSHGVGLAAECLEAGEIVPGNGLCCHHSAVRPEAMFDDYGSSDRGQPFPVVLGKWARIGKADNERVETTVFILDAPSPGRHVRETPRAAVDLRPYACCPSG
jgi:tetratricopeptide (TPR) repeat protein